MPLELQNLILQNAELIEKVSLITLFRYQRNDLALSKIIIIGTGNIISKRFANPIGISFTTTTN